MNERIKELAEQAWDATSVSPEFGHPVSFADKFAELIVQECVSLCVHDANDDAYDDCDIGRELQTKAIRERILDHFGVES